MEDSYPPDADTKPVLNLVQYSNLVLATIKTLSDSIGFCVL